MDRSSIEKDVQDNSFSNVIHSACVRHARAHITHAGDVNRAGIKSVGKPIDVNGERNYDDDY